MGYKIASEAAGVSLIIIIIYIYIYNNFHDLQGYWMPYGYDLDLSIKIKKEIHDLSAKMTFDYFQQCIKNKKYRGLRYLDCIYINIDPNIELSPYIPQSINI